MKFNALFNPETGSKVELDHQPRPPMPDSHLRALCLLAAAGLYTVLVLGVAALCGTFGVLIVAAATLIITMLSAGV